MVQWLQCSLDPHFEVMVKNNEGYTYRNLLVPLIFFLLIKVSLDTFSLERYILKRYIKYGAPPQPQRKCGLVRL